MIVLAKINSKLFLIALGLIIIFLPLCSSSALAAGKTEAKAAGKKTAAVKSTAKSGKASLPAKLSDFKYIPENYDLFILIKPAELLNELSVSAKIKAFVSLTPLKSLAAVRSVMMFVAFGRHKKGNIDFIAVADTPAGFDYDKFIEALAAACDGLRTGDYEGKTVFRLYNLAGCSHGGKLIVSSATGLKNVLAGIKGVAGKGSLSDRKDFTDACARALDSGTKKPFIAVMGKKMLGAAAGHFDESEFAYKKPLAEAERIIFEAAGRSLKITVKYNDAGAAAAFKDTADRQIEQSLKDSAEALAEVDIIETESKSRKLTRLALKEIVYARKLLKFTIDLNKNAKTAIDSTSVEVNTAATNDIFKAIDELICAHVQSWGIITRMFLSSEVSCSRNIKILETAALIYLSKYPEKKNTITAENIFESELLSDYLRCPEDGEYKISVDEKSRIIVGCSVHRK
ncbi:MAG TPA: hypothetical protein DC017_11905 [Candidatus Wallbacteria bacterium]|nr:hypothetical protein [Candidatus Wallbacteria bacterium]